MFNLNDKVLCPRSSGGYTPGIITRIWDASDSDPYVTVKLDKPSPVPGKHYAKDVRMSRLQKDCDMCDNEREFSQSYMVYGSGEVVRVLLCPNCAI